MTRTPPTDVFLALSEQRLWALFDAGRQAAVAGKACELFQEAMEHSSTSVDAGAADLVGDALRCVGEKLEERRRKQSCLPGLLASAVVLSVQEDKVRLHCIGDCIVHRAREGRGEVLIGPHVSSLLGWEGPDILRGDFELRDGDIYSLVPSSIELTVEPGDGVPALDSCLLLAEDRVLINGDESPSSRITIRVAALSAPIPQPPDGMPPAQEGRLKAAG